MFRPLCLLMLCLGLVAARAAEPHPSLPPPVIPDCLGVNIHFTDPRPGELEMLAAAGFKWVRLDFGWQGTERKKGEYDFSAYDRLVAALDKFQIRAVFILDYGNPLYAEPGDVPYFTSRAHTPEFRAAFGKWAVAAVQHFKGRGYLWEMWNEPNGGFWKSPDKIGDYIALAKSTGEALRQAGLLGPKGEAFIGPATSTIDLPYLEACFRAGLLDYWDAVSVHPYRQGAPETVEEEYRSVRLLIRKYAPKDKTIPIISGEWGYSDAWQNSDWGSGAITRQFLTNVANDVALSIWYDWHDDGPDPKEAEHHFGLVEHEWTKDAKQPFKPKRAYEAVKVLTEELQGYRFNKRLLVKQENSKELPSTRLYLFSRGPTEQKLTLYSTAANDDHRRFVYVPASHGLFRVRDEVFHVPLGRVAAGDDGIMMERPWGIKFLTPEQPNDFLRVATASPRAPLEYIYHWPEAFGDTERHFFTAVVNPLDRPITLRPIGFSGVDEVLEPGKESTSEYFAWSNGRMARRRNTSWDRVDTGGGQVLDLQQESTLVALNPLEVEPLPPTQDALHFRVLNPSGEAASLLVHDIQFGSDHGLPLEFKAGELAKMVSVPRNTEERGPALKNGIAIDQSYQIPNQPARLSDVFQEWFGDWLGLSILEHGKLNATCDGDSAVSGSAELKEIGEHPPNSSSSVIALRYGLGKGWKFAQVRGFAARIGFPQANAPWSDVPWLDQRAKQFGLWVHGDGKGLVSRLRFVDVSGQTFQPDGPKIDWTGWRFVIFPMKNADEKSLAHWGGADDGEIHYPIQWDSIFLLDNVSRQPVDGEIYLSAPTLIY
ncbi:MAG: hypothetical protein P4L99_25780 [Chthoniobacter sp.]|nr:hypothetical protein [Chthoniobacter sp.]